MGQVWEARDEHEKRDVALKLLHRGQLSADAHQRFDSERRILARLGHKVQHLRRIAVGPLRLGDTPSGAYRPVTPREIDQPPFSIQ